jgi:hypothetical protein
MAGRACQHRGGNASTARVLRYPNGGHRGPARSVGSVHDLADGGNQLLGIERLDQQARGNGVGALGPEILGRRDTAG